LTDEKEHHKDEINEKSLRVEEPHFACLVAQHQKSSNTANEQQKDRQQENDFEDNFDELVDSAGN
jgi:hypothetical protein